MSRDAFHPADWWKLENAQRLERVARSKAAASGVNAGDFFLLVTEGTVTEPVYFDLLRKDLKLLTARVCIEPGKHSDPCHVIETAARLAKGQAAQARKDRLGINEPVRFDQVWAIIDTDTANPALWNKVETLARRHRVQLAHSTPCFEFWLLLHAQGFTTRSDLVDGATAKAALKIAVGADYGTDEKSARRFMPQFFDKWPEAVVHAESVRKHHTDTGTPYPSKPQNPSTEVCALVRALNDSALPHRRKL